MPMPFLPLVRRYLQHRRDQALADVLRGASDMGPQALLDRVHACLARGANPNAGRLTQSPVVIVLERLGSSIGDTEEGPRVATLRALLDAGADPNAPRTDGRTPVHLAASRGLWSVFELLVAHGADPLASCQGFTALHWSNDVRITGWLLEHGADVHASVDGHTPLSMARAALDQLTRPTGRRGGALTKAGDPQVAIEQAQLILQRLEAHTLRQAAGMGVTPTPRSGLGRSRL